MSGSIEVVDVSKRFRIYREKPSSLKQRLLSGRVRADAFWALRDVSFQVQGGEALALIGHNGSGKTTMLKIIAGILRPTEGLVRQRGRLTGLLELGAGFHHELTGKDNVYLNAAFLGLSRKDTDRVYDDIVAFAELEEFMGTAVKFFSSGMLVRLGFACAVHVDPEIVLIDEVLAVGDEAFQARCLDRIRSFRREGRTIVFVTHELDLVHQFCTQAIMLDHGVVHARGDPEEVVHEMRMTILKQHLDYAHDEGSREIEIVATRLLRDERAVDGPLHPGDIMLLEVELDGHRPVDDPIVSVALHDGTNNVVFGTDTARTQVSLGSFEGRRTLRFRMGPLPFTGGRYWMTVGVHSRDNQRVYHVQDQRSTFEVERLEGRREQFYMPVEVEVVAQ